MLRVAAVIAFLLLLPKIVADDSSEPAPELLVKKSFNSYVMVEDKEFVIVYNIYNIGDEDALDVSLSDDSPEQVATIIGRERGSSHAHWSRLEAGKNLTHLIVLRPRHLITEFGINAVENLRHILESPANRSVQRTEVENTVDGAVRPLSSSFYERKLGVHTGVWGYFVFFVSVLCIFPLLQVKAIRARYLSADAMLS